MKKNENLQKPHLVIGCHVSSLGTTLGRCVPPFVVIIGSCNSGGGCMYCVCHCWVLRQVVVGARDATGLEPVVVVIVNRLAVKEHKYS